jgi:hypothetical protein
VVRSPKTAHHEGKSHRLVPITPDLRASLQAVFDEAEPGTVHVVTRYRESNCNLRTQLHRILARAGVTPWPRTFHNLRASCETEWAERLPAHVAASWLGHSPTIAARHYLRVRESDFEQAARLVTPRVEEIPAFNVEEKAALHHAASSGTEVADNGDSLVSPQQMHIYATSCVSVQRESMERRRLELPTSSLQS